LVGLQLKNNLDWAVNGPPAGVWITELGTANCLMLDTLRLHADGTGELTNWSAMRGEEHISLLWRYIGPGELQINAKYPDMDTTLGNADADVDAPNWETVRYAAGFRSNDVAQNFPALHNTNAATERFWNLCGPVVFASRQG
jgi:hypothetical protein